MKIILICTGKEFDAKRLKLLKANNEVIFIDAEKTDLHNVDELFDNDEKILALSPVPLGWEIPKDIYSKLRNVKYLCLTKTGYDFVDLDECKKYEIKVTNVPYYSTRAVAEYAVFLMFCLLKKLPLQIKNNFKYEFNDELVMEEIGGKRVGIIGLGHIGLEISKILSNMGMEINYWSRSPKKTKLKRLELSDLIANSDIIFTTLQINVETSKLLQGSALSQLRTGTFVINTSGEPLLDHKYLVSQTENNFLGGYGFESDRETIKDFEGNIMVTAPLAWYTKGSLDNNIEIWKDTILSCTKDQSINLVV